MEKELLLTRDQEADLIVEKLKKTDLERERDIAARFEQEILEALNKVITDEIDKDVLNKLKSLYTGD